MVLNRPESDKNSDIVYHVYYRSTIRGSSDVLSETYIHARLTLIVVNMISLKRVTFEDLLHTIMLTPNCLHISVIIVYI